eukprot:gene48811-31378_t
MPGWAQRRAEWRDAAEHETYTVTVPKPWRASGAALFSFAGPLATPQLQRLDNTKVRRKAMLRYGETVAAALGDADADAVDLALRHFAGHVLRLKPEHAGPLAETSTAQVCALLAATFEHPAPDGELVPLAAAVAAWHAVYDPAAARADLAAALRESAVGSPQRAASRSRSPPARGGGGRSRSASRGRAEPTSEAATLMRVVTELSAQLRDFRTATDARFDRVERGGDRHRARRVAVESPRPSPTPSDAGDDDAEGYTTFGDDGDDAHHPDRWDPNASDTDSDATDFDADLDDLDALCTRPCAHRLLCDAAERGETAARVDHRDLYARQRARAGRLQGERRSRALDLVDLQRLLHTPGKRPEQLLRRLRRVVGDMLAEVEWGGAWGDALREPRRLAPRHAAAWRRLRQREAADAALPRTLRGRADLAALDAAERLDERRDPLRRDDPAPSRSAHGGGGARSRRGGGRGRGDGGRRTSTPHQQRPAAAGASAAAAAPRSNDGRLNGTGGGGPLPIRAADWEGLPARRAAAPPAPRSAPPAGEGVRAAAAPLVASAAAARPGDAAAACAGVATAAACAVAVAALAAASAPAAAPSSNASHPAGGCVARVATARVEEALEAIRDRHALARAFRERVPVLQRGLFSRAASTRAGVAWLLRSYDSFRRTCREPPDVALCLWADRRLARGTAALDTVAEYMSKVMHALDGHLPIRTSLTMDTYAAYRRMGSIAPSRTPASAPAHVQDVTALLLALRRRSDLQAAAMVAAMWGLNCRASDLRRLVHADCGRVVDDGAVSWELWLHEKPAAQAGARRRPPK